MEVEEQLTQVEIKKVKKLVENYNISRDYVIGSLHYLAQKVCNFYRIEINDFLSQRRHKYLIRARRDFIHMAKKRTQKNYSDIARFLNKDHTTILHHINKKPSLDVHKIIDE